MKKKFYILLSMALMLLTPTSCIYDKDESCGEPLEHLTIQLRISLPSAAVSRAESENGKDHEKDPGIPVESAIDVKGYDYRVLVFDSNSGALITDDVLMVQFEQESQSGNTVTYRLLGEVDLRGSDATLDKFKVMVLANWNAYDKTGTYARFNFQKSLGLIYADGDNFNFTSPSGSDAAWAPSISESKLIPMFGISEEIDVSKAVEDHILVNDPIPMLRSIAKVEIVDNLSESTPITSIKLSKASANGRFIPNILNNTSWNDDAKQVTTPSLPTTTTEYSDVPFFKGSQTYTVDGKEKAVWVAYIPEMILASRLRTDRERPAFTITAGSGTQYTFRFDNYIEGKEADQQSKELQHVLRNHIYRYIVEAPSSFLTVTSEVLDWDVYTPMEFIYDAPVVSSKLEWIDVRDGEDEESTDTDPTKAVLMKSSNRLLMMTGTDNSVEGRFTLSAPMNATWRASLVHYQGATDAFQFLDEEGNEHSDWTGIIDGNVCTIRIKNKYEQVSEVNNEARLEIMVEYPDQTTRQVQVVDDKNGIVNAIIVQQLTEIMQ